jgi:succinate-semialdehyde dehydrogenase / glutarate-semialdehyde dehydrogenase
MTQSHRTAAFINGQWIQTEKTFAVRNPATGAVVALVSDCSPAEARAAITAAAAAAPAWAAMLAKERAAILRRWGELIIAHTEALAQTITAEGGKPLAEARGEVTYGASFCEWYAEEGKRAYGRVVPQTVASRRYVVIKQPVGVVAAITPWNFPLGMVTRKAAPALAAGCPIVLKPAEATPLTALLLADLAAQAGVPDGVLNVIPTNDAAGVGGALCESPLVRKLSFTGSTRVGKLLAAQCAGTVKRLSLELGGNAPFVIFEDADIDVAAAAVMAAKFRNAGQVCTTPNRILVQAAIYDRFAAALAGKVKALKVGAGDQDGVQVGPLISEAGVAKVERLVQAALASGAKAQAGGARHPAGGQFFAPTVLTGVSQAMEVAQEEIFGPVLPLIRFETEAEAISIANDTPYGLQAYFFARDVARAWRVAEQLEYGMVCVNDGLMSNEVAPFGGFKESGIGREGGQEGLEAFLETKLISFNGIM